MKIISLTTIPSRFGGLTDTLESLVAQEVDEVRLYIPDKYSRFPDWDGALPKVPAGVKICRTEVDLGPATKILPACRDFRGLDVQIMLCDDDCILPKGWASRLFRIQSRRPHQAVATYVRTAEPYLGKKVTKYIGRAWELPIKYDAPYRFSRLLSKAFGTPTLARRPFVVPGYGEIFFGVGGAIVRPEFFDDIAFDIPEVAKYVDDIWLSANLARLKVPIYCPWMARLPIATDLAHEDALLDSEFESQDRQKLNRSAAKLCHEKFNIWN